jgi:hypothetical protein
LEQGRRGEGDHGHRRRQQQPQPHPGVDLPQEGVLGDDDLVGGAGAARFKRVHAESSFRTM